MSPEEAAEIQAGPNGKAPMESLGTSFLDVQVESGHFVFFGLLL